MATRCLAADEEFFESINKHVSLLWNNNKEKVIKISSESDKLSHILPQLKITQK